MATIISREDADKQIIYAVGANYASNEYIPDGNKGGISLNDVTSGSDAIVQARCVVEGFAKPAGQTWAEGEYLYFDPVAKTATSVEQADGLFRFKAYKAALIDATTGDIEVIQPIFDDLIDAAAIAYDNSTSGLAATDVQGAIDEVDGRVDALESDIAGAVTMGGIWNDNMRNSTTTAQSIADATSTIIDLEVVELVGDVTYAAGTTSLATIPVGGDGVYALAYELTFAAGAGTYNAAEIYKNGAYYTDTTETPDNANPIFVSDYVIMYLAAGDTIGLWGKQDSGGALNVTAGRLAIQRLQ